MSNRPMRETLARIIDWFRRDSLERDLKAELRFHAAQAERDARAGGASPVDAAHEARRRMGSDLRATEAARDRWSIPALESFLQDVRYAARSLRRAPAFTAVVTLTLALGIGATTAVFSVAHGVLFAPLPYDDPDRLVFIYETSPRGDARNPVSSGNVLDWRVRAHSFSALGAFFPAGSYTLTTPDGAEEVMAAELEPAALRATGVNAVLGRAFLDDDARGGNPVALLSHGYWERRFGGDSGVVGREITVNGTTRTVVGVMPASLAFPSRIVEVWLPMQEMSLDPAQRVSHNYGVIARLAPGSTIESASAEMVSVVAGITRDNPAAMTGWGTAIVPVHEQLTTTTRPLLIVLLAGVGLLLLIVCGNLTNLLLARAVARDREMAVRGALGAGRSRIARQLLTENLLLALAGGLVALAALPALVGGLLSIAPGNVPLLERVSVNRVVLAFSAAVTVLCALAFGLAPVVRIMRTDLQSVLGGARNASQRTHNRTRLALLTAQVALSVTLLVGAGLLIRSAAVLNRVDLGFDSERLVTMTASLPREAYLDNASHVAFFDRLVERARAVPGVSSVAATTVAPAGGFSTFSFSIEGRESANASGREDPEQLHAVTPGYFATMGQRIVTGRAFGAEDGAGAAPVVIISEALARKHWPDENLLGRRISFRVGQTPWMEIVGVAADVRIESPDIAPVPAIYIPFAQKYWTWMRSMTVIARVDEGAPDQAVTEGLKAALFGTDRYVPPSDLSTVSNAFGEATARRRFAMTLVTCFGVVALILTVVGLYGLLAYNVTQRQREIGVRIALGATPGRIVRSIVGGSLVLAVAGAVAGLAIAFASVRWIGALLFGVPATDPLTYAAAATVVLVAAAVTALVPALRASRTPALEAIRSESS